MFNKKLNQQLRQQLPDDAQDIKAVIAHPEAAEGLIDLASRDPAAYAQQLASRTLGAMLYELITATFSTPEACKAALGWDDAMLRRAINTPETLTVGEFVRVLQQCQHEFAGLMLRELGAAGAVLAARRARGGGGGGATPGGGDETAPDAAAYDARDPETSALGQRLASLFELMRAEMHQPPADDPGDDGAPPA